jgi:hypothetical protein
MSKPSTVTTNADGTLTSICDFTVKGVKKRSTTVTRTTTITLPCIEHDKTTGGTVVDFIETPCVEILSYTVVDI